MKSTQFEEPSVVTAGPRRWPRFAGSTRRPPEAGPRCSPVRKLTSRPASPNSCRERTCQMRAPDVLGLAEIERDTLADVTLECWPLPLTSAKTGGQALASVLCAERRAQAGGVRRCGPHRAGRRSAVARLFARAHPGSVAGGGRRGRTAGRADRRHVDRPGPGAAVGGPARRPAGDRLQRGQAEGDRSA